MLKPQDIVILLKILSVMTLATDDKKRTLPQNELAVHICISASEVNAGIKRLVQSGLLGPAYQENAKNKTVLLPIKAACEECLISGGKFFLPAKLGEYTRGVATAYAAPIFRDYIMLGNEPIPVWPDYEGDQRGLALEPLYRTVPRSVIQYPDQTFYYLLVMIDAIRIGKTREREIAVKLLREKRSHE